MSTQRANGRELTDDELSFERMASEIEQLWHEVPPPKPPRPIALVRPAASQPAVGPQTVKRPNAITPRRGSQRVRAVVSPIVVAAIEPARSEAPRSEARRSEPVRSVLASVRSLAGWAPPPSASPAAAPVEQPPAAEPATSRESGDKGEVKPVLLPLCRPDVRIAVGDTVAVLNWLSHDGRPILMPIGLDGLEQLAHAVADAIAVSLRKDLQRDR